MFKQFDAISTIGFDDVEQGIDVLDLRKPSVKRMHRPHKSDAQIAGREKIEAMFHRVGIAIFL